MQFKETKLRGCFIIEPQVFEDERGCFYESFRLDKFENAVGRETTFIQDNQSKSSYGVLRGLHFQQGEHTQAKLVKVLSGEVLDVAVDLRKNSPTFGQYESVILSAENKRQVFVPRGFAHGFVVLSHTAEFYYKCDNYYNQESEGGIRFDDPDLAIDWQLPNTEIQVSLKDSQFPSLKDFDPSF